MSMARRYVRMALLCHPAQEVNPSQDIAGSRIADVFGGNYNDFGRWEAIRKQSGIGGCLPPMQAGGGEIPCGQWAPSKLL
jgi:hypothetical protein